MIKPDKPDEQPQKPDQKQKPPVLLLARGDVTDPSGRHFKNITAFEYALWVMDWHMYTMMLDCLPQDETGYEIKKDLLAQYEKVEYNCHRLVN